MVILDTSSADGKQAENKLLLRGTERKRLLADMAITYSYNDNINNSGRFEIFQTELQSDNVPCYSTLSCVGSLLVTS